MVHLAFRWQSFRVLFEHSLISKEQKYKNRNRKMTELYLKINLRLLESIYIVYDGYFVISTIWIFTPWLRQLGGSKMWQASCCLLSEIRTYLYKRCHFLEIQPCNDIYRNRYCCCTQHLHGSCLDCCWNTRRYLSSIKMYRRIGRYRSP